ncbi:hypothetical protein M8993_04020 [Pasteurella multocida]|nr:hypothetical protein [Pasteurella multocida]URH76818.1 hypothetical protein M8993_04020 [Pasteurella multocida]URH90750.1 hypothetical protein M8849_04020 [Pasteurella multocida]
MKNVQPTRLDWFFVLLPYVIGLFFAIFDSATIGQVFFWGGHDTSCCDIFIFCVSLSTYSYLGFCCWHNGVKNLSEIDRTFCVQ